MLQRTSIDIFTNVDQLPSSTRDLLQSLLGERSENVVRSYAKRREVHGKEREPPQSPSLAKWAIRSRVFRSLTLARTTIIAPGEQKLSPAARGNRAKSRPKSLRIAPLYHESKGASDAASSPSARLGSKASSYTTATPPPVGFGTSHTNSAETPRRLRDSL